MKIVKRDPKEAEIPTASMADIAFLLIIFFMVTTVFSATKGLEFTLPQEEKDRPVEQEEAVLIQVAVDGSLLVDCQPMTHDQILDYLEPKLTRNPEKPVILYTDADAPYAAMVAVYDVLAQSEEKRGFRVKNIAVPTQSEVQEYIATFNFNPFEAHCSQG